MSHNFDTTAKPFYPIPPLKKQEAEDLAVKIATYLPDNKAIDAAFKSGDLKYPESIVRWEIGAINQRAWSIYRQQKLEEQAKNDI